VRLKHCEIICRIIVAAAMIVLVVLTALCIGGCAHNTGAFMLGQSFKAGFDSQNAIPSITYIDGFMATDISRENSGWELEIDATTGISVGKDGTVKGIKKIKRFVGPQFNGYLVELAKENPELAKAYFEAIKGFWGSNPRK